MRMPSEHDEFCCGCAGQLVVGYVGGPSGEEPHQGGTGGMQGCRCAVLLCDARR